MKKHIVNATTILLTAGLLLAIIPMLTPASAAVDGWTLTVENRSMKAYPDLKESIWQKNASLAPNGPYDKIGLHRLAGNGATTKGAVFIIHGAYGSGEKLASNPSSDDFTRYENRSQSIYWANRGFDVYTIDWRNSFIPINFNKSQLSFTSEWGMDQWVSDIKEAVDKAKEVSGTRKVFMSGMSWGGILAQIYASKYWQEDLQGLILLDPGPMASTISKNKNLTNTYNLTAQANAMKATGAWTYENPELSTTRSPFNPGSVFLFQFMLENPGAPAQYTNGTLITSKNPRTNKTWANITEYFEYSFNAGGGYNTYGGYNDVTSIIQNLANRPVRYLPTKQFLDYRCMTDWTITPYLPYDYFAHIKEIDVPVLTFRSGLNLAAYGNVTNGMATKDFTWILLPNYGHSDVFFGTYSARDVSQPALSWMLNELGLTPRATAFTNVTVFSGWTWNFFVHSTAGAGPYSYQWYEGTTLMAGQTKMVLPVTKNTPGTYSYYCTVTDQNGATSNSNTVTLTVIS